MTIQAEASQPSRRAKWLAALGFRPKRQARAPEGMRIYAVGDVHGCATQLDSLHGKIAADGATFPGEKLVVYLGDYIDRGPDSRGVVERLMQGAPPGFCRRYLKGNHEAALLDFLANPETYRAWRAYGAPETLMSYGVRPPLFDSLEKFEEARVALQAAVTADHRAFFASLEVKIVLGDYAFVHAGIRPGLEINEQDEQDLLWIREDFLSCNISHDKVIVHGHTPVERPLSLHNRIAVDTGVYATGVLSCVVLEGEERRFIQTGASGRNGSVETIAR